MTNHRNPTRRRRLFLEALEGRAVPAVFTVTNTLDGPVSAAGQLPGSLRQAIFDANASPGADTITFGVTGTITLASGQLTLSDTSGATTIDGPGASLLTISGDNKSRVFAVKSSVTGTIDGVTVTNGYSGAGGGIYNQGTLTLTNSTVSGNSGGAGGGIFNQSNGMLSVTNSTLSGNSATSSGGGGIYNRSNSTLTVTNSTFSGNSGVDGGGIANSGTVTLTNSTLNGNFASLDGGGIANYGTAMLTNSTLSGNIALFGLGGSIISFGTVTLTNSTLSGNSAGFDGGGIVNNGTLNATNSIIAGNTNGDVTNKGINGTNLNNLVNISAAAAGLGALGNYGGPTQTIPLLPGSPAINAGASTTLTFDQRGTPFLRVSGSAVDIGAFESQSLTLVVDVTNDIDNGNSAPGDLSLREAVKLANANPGADTITFAVTGTIALTQAAVAEKQGLPAVTGPLLIEGPSGGIRITRQPGSGDFRLVTVAASGDLTLHRLTISNSQLDAPNPIYGGGVFNNGGTLTISSSSLVDNVHRFVGSALYSRGTTRVVNSTIANNSGPFGPTAIFAEWGSLTIESSTVVGNVGGATGTFSGVITLTNSIVAGNRASDGTTPRDLNGNISASSSGNLIGTGGSGGLVNGVNGNIVGVSDAKLGTLGSYGGPTQTIPLLPGSPAVNAGGSTTITTDQRGVARDGRPDIGAYEFDAFQPSLVVTTLADEDNGTSDPAFGAGTSLREALFYAEQNAGADTITFAPGLTGTITLTSGWANGTTASALEVFNHDVTVRGPAAGGITVAVAPGANRRHFYVYNNGSLTLDRLTLTGGDVTAGVGGAIENAGALTVRRSVLANNSAGEGGAIQSGGPLTIEDSTFFGNASKFNGGALRLFGNSVIRGSSFFANSAVNEGGALINFGNLLVIDNSTFVDNDKNAVLVWEGTAQVTNTTIASNRDGGLVLVSTTPATVRNTIVAGNAGGDLVIPGAPLSAGSGNNLLNLSAAAAGLGALGAYGGPTQTIPLLPGSPAINAGGSTTITTDQRGLGRVGAPDIGAFESQGFTVTAQSGGGQTALVGAGFASPLVVAVSANNPVEPVDGGTIAFTAPGSGASATLAGNPATIAGGQASVTATASGARGTYTVTAGGANFSLTNEVQPSFSVTARTVTYGDAITLGGTLVANGEGATGSVTVTISGNGITPLQRTAALGAGGGFSAVFTTLLAANANAYTVSYSYAGQDGFRPATAGPTGLTVNRRAASVTPNNATKVVGQADPPLTGTLFGFLPADNVTATYSRTPGETVGDYPISATLSPTGVLANYNITFNTATFSITPATGTPGPTNLVKVQLLGGNLTAQFNNSATAIELSGRTGAVTLRSNNTLIATFAATGSITIITGSGNDTITIAPNPGQAFAASVTVNAGFGNDLVRLGAGGPTGSVFNLNLALGEGNNSVLDQGIVVSGNAVVSAGGGADSVGPWTSPVANMLLLNLGNGTNAATVTGPVGGQLRYTGGAGTDNLTLGGLQSYYLYALMGAGNDTLTFLPGSSIASGFIDFGLGDDSYVPNGVFVGGALNILNL